MPSSSPLLPKEIRQMRLPLTGSPLGHVNSYLIKGDDGYVLVDCGWDMPDVLPALRAELADAGVALEDIRSLVITHQHRDHYGLAATLMRVGRMRLFMHRLDWAYLDTNFRDRAMFDRDGREFMAQNGWDVEPSADQQRAYEAVRRMELVAPDVQVDDGDRIAVSGSGYIVVWTPGHTIGHICLHEPERRLVLTGDHVLDPITPNVSLGRASQGNPLGQYIDSLRKVASLDADLVLPAHGEPFIGLQRRVDELLAHHAEREAQVVAVLDSPLTAVEVARALPWTRKRRRFEDLADTQQRMAVAETISHLELLFRTARAVRVASAERTRYRRARPGEADSSPEAREQPLARYTRRPAGHL